MEQKAKINVVCTKKNARRLLTKLENSALDELPLASVTVGQLLDFLEKKRNNIAVFEIDGEDLLEVQGNESSAGLLLKLLEGVKEGEILFPPVLKSNIKDFIENKRDSLLTMDLVYTGEDEVESDEAD